MNVISDDAVRAAYDVAKKVYLGELQRAKRVRRLERTVQLKPATAADMIENLKHMLRGERYTRKNNAFATDHMLTMILQDFGSNALAQAVNAVAQHLWYYAELATGSRQPKIEKILEKHRALLIDGVRPEVRKERAKQEKVLEDEGYFDPADETDARQRVISCLVRRSGQPAFRKKLLAAYEGKCAITECMVQAILEAAHIVPYRGPKPIT